VAAVGQRLGRYEIESKLGEGSMGVVFRAKDTVLDRVVALKTLPSDGSTDEIQKRFKREAEAIGRMDHPNIVKVYDLGEIEGRLFMAMELLEGEDLRQLSDLRADIPLFERLRIFAEICEGFAYAHTRGVIHRDIKPANIMVARQGMAKILDFGLARVETAETLTRRGVILGTPDYMSPEQATGKPADPRSDVFSAGAVFYEFLTGFKPFRGASLHAVLYNIVAEPTSPIPTLSPETPARVAALVHQMLEKKPEERPTMPDAANQFRTLRENLLRSRGKSTQSTPVTRTSREELAAAVKAHLGRALAHLETGAFIKAAAEAKEALFLDPSAGEASEMLWRATRAAKTGGFAPDGGVDDRLADLFQAAKTQSAESIRQKLPHAYLLAADDPRVREIIRQISG
jgi:serine/threonine-protein kinase